MDLTQFKKELIELPPTLLTSKWVLDRVPHVFEKDMFSCIRWKEMLSKDIQIDGKAIVFTGSSSCGFSLNPIKNFKEFTENSDIDIALVSQFHFDVAWHQLRNLGSKRYKLTEKQKNAVKDHRLRLVYWGTIATDKILEILPFAKTWNFALDKAKKIHPINNRDIKVRIYKDFDSLRAYQVQNLIRLKSDLISEQTLL